MSTLGHNRLTAGLSAVLLTAVCLSGCSAEDSSRSSSSGSSTTGSGSESVQLTAATPRSEAAHERSGRKARGPRVRKLLVVVEENHSLAQMRRGMPYTFRQAKRFGYATSYRAIRHPSMPNYIAIASGTTHGLHDDLAPAAHPLPGHSVFGQALARGKTAGTYAQSMPGNCHLEPSDPYAVKHNPWAYFTQERQGCGDHDVPMSRFGPDAAAGDLPNVGMVIPDLDHDAHDGTLRQADRWFKRLMRKVYAGPDWKSGHLAVVLTADEDDRHSGNKVLTAVLHPSQRHHVVKARLNHYSLTRLYEDVAGLPYLHHAKGARSMSRAFGLRVRGSGS